MKLATEIWPESHGGMALHRLAGEARNLFRLHALPSTLEGWTSHREFLRAEIWRHLGSPFDDDVPLDIQWHGDLQGDGFIVRKLTYQSRPGLRVTANLHVPAGRGPFPAVLNVHGHWAQGKIAARVQGRPHALVRSGYVCLCVDAFGAGERGTRDGEYEYHGGHLGAALLDLGETLMGMQVVDNMRAVSLLRSLDIVDPENIGATGASGGGNQTMWLAALDDRLKAAVPVVSVGTFESYVGATNCICECLPGGLTFTEESGVVALTAPRALKICNALGDSNITFLPSQMLRTFDQAKAVYRLHGAGERLENQVFNEPHGYWPGVREAMLGWFDRWLKGVGDGSPREEPSFEVFEEKRLTCFAPGERPPSVPSIAQFCRDRAAELRGASGPESCHVAAKQDALRGLLGLADAAESFRDAVPHGGRTLRGMAWERLTLRTCQGSLYPVLVRRPATGSAYRIVVHPAGKGVALDALDPASAVDDGRGVLLFDLWGTGETFPTDDDTIRGAHHQLARACLWLGMPMLGIWVDNLRLVAAFARDALGATSLRLEGRGEAGLAGLFAEVCLGLFDAMRLTALPASYAFGESPATGSFAVHLPGILPWGDVELALALCGVDVALDGLAAIDGSAYAPEQAEAFVDHVLQMKRRLDNRGGVHFL